MSPEEYLAELGRKLNLTENERERISEKHLILRERLRALLPVEDDFLTGSYPRNTMIRPMGDDKFDVDFFLCFSNKEFGDYDLPKLLVLVSSALDEIGEEDRDIEEITEQARSIAVVYGDGFQIDVVPAIEIEADVSYRIFDKRTGEAIESNPRLHGSILSQANEETEHGSVRRLVPIIKLLKSWKRDKCDYVKSFHLELLGVEGLRGAPIESFSVGITRFFRLAGNYLERPSLADPANPENVVDTYLDDNGSRGALLSLVARDARVAQAALDHESNGNSEAAIGGWKRIFEAGDRGDEGGDEPSPRGPTVISASPPKPWSDATA